MPGPTLLTIAGDSRELPHVAWDLTTRGGPLVAVELTPTWNSNLIGVDRCILVTKSQQRPLGRGTIVVVALKEGVVLIERLDLDVMRLTELVCPMLDGQVPLAVVAQPGYARVSQRPSP